MLPLSLTTFLIQRAWLILWVLLCAMGLIYLPGFSEYDTTKYLAISQQMMDHHQYLIAYWEGQVYSDKPPLLFWLIIAGWRLFGVCDWWPQLLVLSIATGSFFLTLALFKRLWPSLAERTWLLPLLLVGCFHWYWFAREIRVDSLLTFAVLLSLLALCQTLQPKRWAWLLYTVAIGLGGFAKGPVILVFVFVPALLLPHCLPHPPVNLRRWYTTLLVCSVLGLCIPLSWALPAVLLGGKHFAYQIFFDQIAHRANQHRESRWFYVLRLPLYTLPWSLYPPMWRGLARIIKERCLNPTSWCLLAIGNALLVFSLFGQKIPHYLFPILPLLLMLVAVSLQNYQTVSRYALWPMAGLLIALGAFCLLYPSLANHLPSAAFARGYFLYSVPLVSWGIALFSLGMCLFIAQTNELTWQIGLIATCSLVLTWFFNTQVLTHYQTHIHLDKLPALLADMNQEDIVLAPDTEIKGQDILAILATHQLTPHPVNNLATWALRHPHGLVLTSNLDDFKRYSIQAWWYQERYNLLGVIPASQLL